MKPLDNPPSGPLELYLRSTVFFIAMALSGILIGLLTVLAFPLGFEIRYAIASLWVRFVLWSLRGICKLGFEIQGLENIPPSNCIVLSKHQSTWETIGLQTVFRPVCFILKKELLRLPFWGWAMASLEPIAIDRSAKTAAIKQVLREGEDRLRKGRWLILFPEGTRVAPGTKGRYGASGGTLAKRSGYPVIPVAHNAGEFWPRHGFLKRPGTISVRIGPVIDPTALSADEINQAVEAWIEAQMSRFANMNVGLDGTGVASN
ncbi:MAG: 1-acyl-sn-glycerol-3-phosphate acyltransferase [Gammaproteobacteria bacterium]|nr:1-acyl-sn-glycerol-3-phosphate acyltransferase [Gammaproteobacteria bacterium]